MTNIKSWLRAAGMRAIKTVAQTAAATIGTAEVRALTGADAVCNGQLFNMATDEQDNREESKPMAKYKVCLDAGHGGRESWNGSPKCKGTLTNSFRCVTIKNVKRPCQTKAVIF